MSPRPTDAVNGGQLVVEGDKGVGELAGREGVGEGGAAQVGGLGRQVGIDGGELYQSI